MLFWAAITALLALSTLVTLWPLVARAKDGDSLEKAIAYYKESQAELARQRDSGEISTSEFEAGEAEQARHLLAVDRAHLEVSRDQQSLARLRKRAAIAALAGFPVLSLALYLSQGAPQLPDQPLVARVDPATVDIRRAVEKIEAHLARNPNDGRGYEVVAPVYLRSGRYREASFAYRRVIELLGDSAARSSDLGESLVAEADGVVTADAKAAFLRSVALDAAFSKSRFYLALAREQEGDSEGALSDLRALEAALSDEPARLRVRDEIARLSGDRAQTPADAIAALPPGERLAAIGAMVDQLDTRLASAGGSVEEWLRLVESRLVLDQKDRARDALSRARQALAENGDALRRLDALGARIGETPPTRSAP